MMDRQAFVEALAAARLQGTALSVEEPDGDYEDALALQLDVLRALEARGERVVGWKVGLTSGGGHDLLGKGFRPFGYLLESRRLMSGDTLSPGPRRKAAIEPEICLRLKTDLAGADLSVADCRNAVGMALAAFEINESRAASGSGRYQLFMADGLSNWGLVVGSGTSDLAALAGTRAHFSVDGEAEVMSDADLVFDDPFLSLSRLCATLHRHGLGLKAGQYVITGAFLKAPLDRAGLYRARFDNIGEVALNFRPVRE